MAETKNAKTLSESTAPETTDCVSWTESQVINASAGDITKYISDRLQEYEDDNLYGIELHGYFVADFCKFTAKDFKKTTESAKNLRDFLRKRNVFIQKNRGQSIPTALVDGASNPCCLMPEEMINEVIDKYRPVSSLAALRNIKTSPSPPTSPNNPVITLMKAYKEEQKYAGNPSESFELKFKIFTDYCDTI
ncbi:hypothetical protein K3495_g16520, partial [Podosphaera aphanis]